MISIDEVVQLSFPLPGYLLIIPLYQMFIILYLLGITVRNLCNSDSAPSPTCIHGYDMVSCLTPYTLGESACVSVSY